MEALQLILSSLLGGGIAASLLLYFSRTWLEARPKAAIDFEYQKSFDLFQRQQNQKEKIEMVAELLAEFMRTPANEPVPRDQRVLLNKLSLRSSLWLPADLALAISKRIQNKPDALSPFDLILLARRKLTDDSSLTGEHVTIWGVEKERPNKAPEPTPGSVTPRANVPGTELKQETTNPDAARGAPAPGVAHL